MRRTVRLTGGDDVSSPKITSREQYRVALREWLSKQHSSWHLLSWAGERGSRLGNTE
ncbi:MAG: hypothetical protein U0796_12850 [Gemmatales bacterium]